MKTALWIAGGIGALVVAAALVEAYLKRNTKRRLVDFRPDPGQLPSPEENPIEAAQARKRQLDKQNKAPDRQQMTPSSTGHRMAQHKETRHD